MGERGRRYHVYCMILIYLSMRKSDGVSHPPLANYFPDCRQNMSINEVEIDGEMATYNLMNYREMNLVYP